MSEVSTFEHYERLIDEGIDFCNDPPILQAHMNKWTGKRFLELLQLTNTKDVLEVGVGTGRIAKRVLIKGCKNFTGLDISLKSLEKARINLIGERVELIQQDILEYSTKQKFDIIYSVLTFIHIQDKKLALKKMTELLKDKGVLVISFDNTQSNYLDYGTRKIKIYPTDVELIIEYLKELNYKNIEVLELLDDDEDVISQRTKVATIIKVTKVGR